MRSARRAWKVLLGCAAAVVLLAIAGGFYLLHQLRTVTGKTGARTRAAIAAHREAFLEDQRFLAGLPVFAPRPGQRDAGPLLGPRVRWFLAEAPPGALVLEQRLLDSASSPDWRPGPDDWRGLDFTWMAQLAGYDLWDLDQNSSAPPPQLRATTEPDPRDLFAWVELRLAKGEHDGAPVAALQEVEELARLCFTTERFGTQIQGAILLGRLRRERERAGLAPDPKLDAEGGQRLGRALSGALAFARLETPADFEPDFARIAVGRCAALHDGAGLALELRPRLLDSRRADYQRLERLLAAAPGCRLRRLREQWASPDDPALSKREGWWEWLPGGRRASAEMLVAIGEQNWLRRYQPEGAPE